MPASPAAGRSWTCRAQHAIQAGVVLIGLAFTPHVSTSLSCCPGTVSIVLRDLVRLRTSADPSIWSAILFPGFLWWSTLGIENQRRSVSGTRADRILRMREAEPRSEEGALSERGGRAVRESVWCSCAQATCCAQGDTHRIPTPTGHRTVEGSVRTQVRTAAATAESRQQAAPASPFRCLQTPLFTVFRLHSSLSRAFTLHCLEPSLLHRTEQDTLVVVERDWPRARACQHRAAPSTLTVHRKIG